MVYFCKRMQKIALNGQNLDIRQVVAVARHDAEVEISADAWMRVRESRAFLERVAHSGKVIYAINTGFGSNASVLIDDKETAILQTKLLLSHATGVGKPLSREATRAMMLLTKVDKGTGFGKPKLQEIMSALLSKACSKALRIASSLRMSSFIGMILALGAAPNMPFTSTAPAATAAQEVP